MFEKTLPANEGNSRPRLSRSSLRPLALIGGLCLFTFLVLIRLPLIEIGWESMRVLWIAGGLFAVLCLALAGQSRAKNAQRVAFVLWAFLLVSEGFFYRVGAIDSDFAGSFNMAAYGEAIMWLISFMILIPLFMKSPIPIRSLFAEHYRWATLFALVCFGSCVYSPRPAFSAAWALKLILVTLLIQLCWAYMNDLQDIDWFLRLTFWALTFLIINWVLRGDGEHHFFDEEGRLPGANGLSATAGTLLVLCFTLFSSRKGWGLKRAPIFVAILSFVIMVIAGGKAGAIAGLITAILFLVLRKGFGSAAVFVAAAVVVGMLAISLSPVGRYLQNYSQDDQAGTLTGRTPLWEVAFPAILNKPILGHGYVSSTFISVQLNGVPWEAGHMHNGFLEALYNTGLVGFLLIIGIHVVIARNLLRVVRRADPSQYIYQVGVGCFAIYINLLINGFANASFAGRAWHPFMLLIALLAVSDKLARLVTSESPSPVASAT